MADQEIDFSSMSVDELVRRGYFTPEGYVRPKKPKPKPDSEPQLHRDGPTATASTVVERFGLDWDDLGEPKLWLKASQAVAQLTEDEEAALAAKLKAEHEQRQANKPRANSKAAKEAARAAWRCSVEVLEARRTLVGIRAALAIARDVRQAAGIASGVLDPKADRH